MSRSHLSKLFKLTTGWRHINFFCWSESIVRKSFSAKTTPGSSTSLWARRI